MAIYDQLIQQLKNIDENTHPTEFVRQFLLAYGFPKATIARLNMKDSLTPDTGIGVSAKAIMVFTESENLYTKFDHIRRTVVKNRNFRFIVLFNSRSILALDTETNEWLQVAKKDLHQKFEFFLPLMGVEKVTATERTDVSVKIGEKFAQLYNELLLLNPGKEESINKLLINLIACYFSDSMGLMDKLSIKHWISTYSPNGGSELYALLMNIFQALKSSNDPIPSYIRSRVHATISGLPEIDTTLNFDKSTQGLLLKIADYSWSEVEPEVLGALIQAITSPEENRLGELVRMLIDATNAHVLAMTGSYFRGDGVPVLMPEDEAKFTKVTYNYYEQLNGYTYLKSLGIGFHFYQGKYIDAIGEVLDTDRKTILHIPSVNSGESTKDKYIEVDSIIDSIGEIIEVDPATNIINVKRADGKIIKVADLVNDNPAEREKTISFLRQVQSVDDVDLIIALGMAKEGFDWAFCEHALTVGYRGSLTEIIQIIGRCTRDSSNKTHAQFTNLIAAPDAENDEVLEAVNNMLKSSSRILMRRSPPH